MTTYALKLPDETAAALSRLDSPARAALDDALRGVAVAVAKTLPPLALEKNVDSEDLHAAIAEGIADLEAGRFLTYEQFIEQERAHFQAKGIDFDAALANAKLVIHE